MSPPDSDAAAVGVGLTVVAGTPGHPSPGTEGGEPSQHRTIPAVLKDIALFFAAPFVTIAYLCLFPFIGIAMFRQAWRHRKATG
jgi:hypothetical protein